MIHYQFDRTLKSIYNIQTEEFYEKKENFMKKQISREIFIPFGIEIEMEGIPFEEGKRVIRHKVDENWKMGIDKGLINEIMELSSPVLSNEIETFKKLKKLAKTLQFLNPTFEHASFQINLDADIFGKEDFINLLKMFSVYENIIYRFSMGEDEHIRECAFAYAGPIRRLFYNAYHKNIRMEESYKNLINNKFFALSLKTKTRETKDPIKIVEFRTPNGTYHYDLWFNYITFFSAFLTYIKREDYDKEKIDYLFEHVKFFTCMQELETIDEKKALQLADFIFTNDEDKKIFYKQYVYKK